MKEPMYYTVLELSELWRCSADIVYDLLRRKELTGFKVGSAWRISETARVEFEKKMSNAEKPKRGRPLNSHKI